MSICCSKLVRNIFTSINIIDSEESDIDEQELNRRLQIESDNWAPSDRKEFWAQFIRRVQLEIPDHVHQTLLRFEEEGIPPGTAVELGCGNSALIPELLKKGWSVQAVDNSLRVLHYLREQINRTVPNKIDNLTCVCADMETYEFPENVLLVIAKDSLPYCDPEKIVKVWDRAHASLRDGGRIVGNFFPHPCDPNVATIGRRMMGAWYTDKAVVKSLLDRQSYDIETCDYSLPRYQESFFNKSRQIHFAGKKV